MAYNPEIHHRRSIRLYGYDYAQPGLYCVTSVVKDRQTVFGEVVDGVMQADDAGRIVEEVWGELRAHFPCVDTDAFVLMPNHIHGIVVITEPDAASDAADAPDGTAEPAVGEPDMVGAGSPRPMAPPTAPAACAAEPAHAVPEEADSAVGESGGGETPPLRVFVGRPTLGQVVAYFKFQSAKRINAIWGVPGEPVWQRNYYEHIVRNERELERLRRYIEENPERWEFDDENPARIRAKAGGWARSTSR